MQLHLFDIDVPGKITFQESKTLSPGDSFSTFDTRKYQISAPGSAVSVEEDRAFFFFFPPLSYVPPQLLYIPCCKTRSEKGRDWPEI